MVSSTSAIYSKNPSPGSPRAGASSWSASVGTAHRCQHRQAAALTRQRGLTRRLRSALFLCYPLWVLSAPPLLDARCLLAFAIGAVVIFLSYGPVGSLSRWLGAKSRIKERTAKEEGVPVWITGNFERLLAFFLVLFHVEGAYALLALWLGAKLAASWHRLPTEPYGNTKNDDEKREYGRQIRAGTLCALIAGIVSVLIGAFAGLVVRSVCQCCMVS